MKRVLLALAAVFCALLLDAVPARPGFIRSIQPDGTVIWIRRHGDEWDHWTSNEKGQVLRRHEDGFFRVDERADARSFSSLGARRRRAAMERATRRMAVRSPWRENRMAMGRRHYLVLMVEFSDLSFTVENPLQVMERVLNEEGYSEGRATGSARDYYFDNSHGLFEPIFDIYGPVKLDKEKAYYGKNDKSGYDLRPAEAVRDALLKLDGEIDCSRYDYDGDGEVDLVYMLFAGFGEADSSDDDAIWPHQWYFSEAGISLSLDGKRIDNYACGAELQGDGEMDGIGTLCHEFGHAIGLPDFYDTDYERNGQAAALICFSLMDMGLYNNDGWTPPLLGIEERMLLGWVDESALQEIKRNGEYRLGPVDENLVYKIPTGNDGEYFVLESRGAGKWDSALPAQGLLVFHADKSSASVRIMDAAGSYQDVTARSLWDEWGVYNAINECGKHPCYYIVPSPDQQNLLYGFRRYSGYGYVFDESYAPRFPFPGSQKITDYTPVAWSGDVSEVSLNQIGYALGEVTFQVKGIGENPLDYPVIANPGKGAYASGQEFLLELEVPRDFISTQVRWYFDGAQISRSSVTLTSGSHLVQAEVTDSTGRRMQISLELQAE